MLVLSIVRLIYEMFMVFGYTYSKFEGEIHINSRVRLRCFPVIKKYIFVAN